MKSIVRLWFVLAWMCVAMGSTALADDSTYLVGVSKVDITPDYPVRLNGFGSRRDESTGVSQRIWAKALAISLRDELPVVIFTCDNLGIREPMLDQVAAELKRRFGIPRENITLTFTHTHCAPKVNGASDTIFSSPIPPEHQAHIDQYTSELTQHLMDVAAQAIENRAPATLECGIGKVTFARNRRTPGGQVDHDLPILVVRGEDGKPRAIYVTYACHCVTLAFNQISGDWAGYAQEHIEKSFPDCVAMVSIGCGSDSNPESGVTGDNLVSASDQGREIADEVHRLLTQPLRPIEGPVSAKLEHIELALNDLPTRTQLEERVKAGGPDGFNAQSQLAKLDAGQELLRALHYPIHTITFGDDLHMVFLAGEVCVDYALSLKTKLDHDRTWLHGYSNDFCSYIPSERLLQEGGYGGGGEICYFDLPAVLKAGVEQTIVDAVLQQTPTEFQVKPGTRGIAPKSPEDSLRCMRTHDDLRIELVAAEPLVDDPVAIDFGPDGRLWVAEMADYTRQVEEEFEPHGRIRFLTDADQDGRYDRATTFLEGLRFPTDVKVWRDGVLVCDAPDILFAADRDGDGRAEVREVWFTGFATHNPHGRVNGLRFGLDGWIYGSGGLFGGKIKNRDGVEVDLQNRDFRLKPDEGIIEGAMGVTQQGRPRDDWDNWFGCTNSQLLLHYPLREEYARRNPHVTLPPTIVSVPDATHGEQLYPPNNLVMFKLTGAPGRPTSACGAEIYRDTYLGDEYYGNAFVCEPVNQLVHRMVLRPNGCTFSGSRHPSESHSEFLTSTDRWFRPVQARTGPDGALWIVDMYRYVIEHPRWIPPETIKELDLMAGQGMGRIYRVVRKDTPPTRPLELSEERSDEGLAVVITSSNGVQRDLAEQMLIWRNPKVTPLPLEQILQFAKLPAARIQAASTLAALGKLTAEQIQILLKDESPDVRRLAMRFAEPIIAENNELALKFFESPMPNDLPHLAQVANSLGKIEKLSVVALLADPQLSQQSDPYLQHAILSSINKVNAVDSLEVYRESIPLNSRDEFEWSLIQVVAQTAAENAIAEIVHLLLPKEDDAESDIFGVEENDDVHVKDRDWLAIATVLDVIERRRIKLLVCIDVEDLNYFNELLASAVQCLEQSDEIEQTRVAALKLLGRKFDRDLVPEMENLPQKIEMLMSSRFAPAVQAAALNAFVRCQPGQAVSKIIDQWTNLTPRLRQEAINLFLSRQEWTEGLLSGLESQVVNAGDFDAARRQKLLEHENADVRTRAEKLFGAVASPNELVKAWENTLALTGDVERGRVAYVKVCSVCHVLDGVGFDVGPDLAALTTKTPQSILVSTLDPNREVDGRYLSYNALLADGKTISGLLVSESATSVTLREKGGKDHVLLRQDLDELRATQKSVMPEGMEKDLDQQSMADIIAYLMPQRTPPKTFAGNQPAVIRPEGDGSLVLSATTAEIYGGPIVFESAFQNIGYWQTSSDFVGWPIELSEPHSYLVQMNYACPPDSAGNPFRIDGVTPPIRAKVASTGAWSTYQFVELGRISLPAGRSFVSVRFDGQQTAPALMDLRELKLVPIKGETAKEP